MRRYFFVAISLLLFPLTGIHSQTHLTIPLDDPVYHILDIAHIRGALPRLSSVRPFTQTAVIEHLRLIQSQGHLFTESERAILDSFYSAYTPLPKPLRFDLGLDSDIRTDLVNAADYHLFSAYNFVFFGDISPLFSFRFLVAPTIDRVNSDAFAPYSFTKFWDFKHVGTESGEQIIGDFDELAIAQAYYPELSFSAFDDRLSIKWSKTRRNWGLGISSLQLTGTANPFEAIEGSLDITEWLKYTFLTGSLGDFSNKKTSQAMISTKRVEFFITKWLYLALYDSVIWGKRLELNYLNPFSVAVLAQGVTGDLDNIFTGGSLSFRFAPYFQAYFSIFMDDYRIDEFQPFEHPLWKFALYGGVKAPIPFLPLTLLTIQYTKVEPWMYTHYPQPYPFFSELMDISYVHSGESLGYYLPPNSDEFLVKLKSMPLDFLSAFFMYQYIRHGDGDISLGQVEGDINKPQRTDLPGFTADDLPRKDFLNDSIYEYIHIVTLSADAELDLGIFHLRFGPEYSLVSAENFQNVEGNSVVKHILGFSVQGSFNVLTWDR